MKASCKRGSLFLALALLCSLLHNPAQAQADTGRIAKSQPDTTSADARLAGEDYTEIVRKNLMYPTEAMDKSIEGMVVLKLTITAEGKLKDIEVEQGVDGGCTEEAIRVAKLMDNWVPARLHGKNVEGKVIVRTRFTLDNNDPSPKRKHRRDKKDN